MADGLPVRRRVRTSLNQVTGELERVEMTPVRIAVERVRQVVDGHGVRMTNAQYRALLNELKIFFTNLADGKG